MKTKKRIPRKVVAPSREHRFDCKVSVELFKKANASRTRTWPELVEEMFQRVIAEGKKK